MVPVAGRPAARGSWHVPPRGSLQKNLHAPTDQTEATADPKLAGHTCTFPTAFGVAVPEGRRLHALGEENFFDVGSSGESEL